jgi:RNA polymerase sigma factor (sigma-70 family)
MKLRETEFDIWQSLIAGEEQALGRLYEMYFSVLYNYGIKVVRDKQLVKDCIQDLFIELWKYHSNLGQVHSVKSYLYKSLRRRLLKEVERHRLHFVDEKYNFEFVGSYEFHLINEQMDKQQKNELIEAMNKLTKRQKEAIFLKFYENLSYQEVASVMAITIKATYKVVLSAIYTLRTHLKKIYLFTPLLTVFL